MKYILSGVTHTNTSTTYMQKLGMSTAQIKSVQNQATFKVEEIPPARKIIADGMAYMKAAKAELDNSIERFVSLANAGGIDKGDYADSLTLNNYYDLVVNGRSTEPTMWKAKSTTSLPHVVDATAYPSPYDNPNIQPFVNEVTEIDAIALVNNVPIQDVTYLQLGTINSINYFFHVSLKRAYYSPVALSGEVTTFDVSDPEAVTITVSGTQYALIDNVANSLAKIAKSEADITSINTSVAALIEGQVGGIKVYETYAELTSYTPVTAIDRGTSYKVTNDSDSSKNGYYSWVSGTTYRKNADLVVNAVDKGNTSDSISGKAVFDYIAPHFYYGSGRDQHRTWFSGLTQSTITADQILTADGVIDIKMQFPDLAYTYSLHVVTKTETDIGYGTRLGFKRSDGESKFFNNLSEQYDGSPINLNGINILHLDTQTWGGRFIVVIDYGMWPDNTLALNGDEMTLSADRYVTDDDTILTETPGTTYQLFSLAGDKIVLKDGVSRKKLVFGASSPGKINIVNTDNNYNAYLELPENYEIEFSSNFRTIGIDLTSPSWANNSTITELSEVAYNLNNLRKDFIPIAGRWSSDEIYIYPEFAPFFDLIGNVDLTVDKQVEVPYLAYVQSSVELLGKGNDQSGTSNPSSQAFTKGFIGKTEKLTPALDDSVSYWLHSQAPDNRIAVSDIDITVPLILQLDYSIDATSDTVFSIRKYQQGFETGNGAGQVVELISDGLIHRVAMAYTPSELAALNIGGNSFIVDYISRSGGNATELTYNNLHYFQSVEPITDPVKQTDLILQNAQALNSALLTEQLVQDTFFPVESVVDTTSAKSHSIVLSGSSITWGDGTLDGDFVGDTDKRFMKSIISKTKSNDDSGVVYNGEATKTELSNESFYQGKATKVTGVGAKITFTHYGDEVAICQSSLRTTDHAKIKLSADGVVIGYFDNANTTLSTGLNEVLTGNGTDVKFNLESPFTYNHVVSIDGGAALTGNLLATTYGVTDVPDGLDYIIIRQFKSDGTPTHAIWFAVAPTGNISVSYDVGRVLAHTKSTVGQLTSDGLINEGVYGNGTVAFDPANASSVSSGMEFRSIDKSQYIISKFLSTAYRTIELEIVDGVNPYIVFDHVTTRYHNLMNAGIGGWSLSKLLDDDGVNDYYNLFKDFEPDVLIQESCTNDDWPYGARKISRTISGVTQAELRLMGTLELNSATWQGADYDVVSNTGLITSAGLLNLISPQIVGSSVAVGDIVRIGNYCGDNKQVITREITFVDTGTGEIRFTKPINADHILNVNTLGDLVGAEIAIRDLTAYADMYRDLITKIRAASGAVSIGITQGGLSNYLLRQLWGYDIIHRKVAAEFTNTFVIEITDWLYDFQNGNISGDVNQAFTSDGSASYALTGWTGHWQGFKVFVDGVDVYGKDCYVTLGRYYSVDPSLVGAAANFSGDYTRDHETRTATMELVFFQNAPNGEGVIVEKADSLWSGDLTHANTVGSVVYGQAYTEALKNNL